jgi:hypothetical protein
MNVTREAVLSAMKECDAVGTERFLTGYGYGLSVSYVISHDGKQYPSKAILGVAAGLEAKDFFGGAAGAVRILKKLGFQIIKLIKEVFAKIATIARDIKARLPFKMRDLPEYMNSVLRMFSSGLTGGYILGAAITPYSVGVAAQEVTARSEELLCQLADTETDVFVDSGAFQEMSSGKTIPDEQWHKRLGLYERLAKVLGTHLWVVAPDKIGDQVSTLYRQIAYREIMWRIRDLGANVLVPVQKGARTLSDFWRGECQALGFMGVPALPCKKAATTPAEVGQFVSESRPPLIHLLGLGAFSSKIKAYLDAAVGTDVQVDSCDVQVDSCMLRASVGTKGGPKACGGLQKMTFAQHLAMTMGLTVEDRHAAVFAAMFGMLNLQTI